MLGWVQRQPLPISIAWIFLVLLLIPAVFGFLADETVQGRTFLYAFVLGGIALSVFSLAVETMVFQNVRQTQLLSVVGFFLLLPVFLAIPVAETTTGATFLDSYLDMVSALTTTGLPVFESTEASLTHQVWRGLVGWVGGLFMWVFAWAVFAPMSLGGFEHLGGATVERSESAQIAVTQKVTAKHRFWREFLRLAPIYIWITVSAALLMMVAGVPPLVASARAMGSIATFGFEIHNNHETASFSSFLGEVVVAMVLLFALSRSLFSKSLMKAHQYKTWNDPEIKVAVMVVVAVTSLMSLGIFSPDYISHSFLSLMNDIWAVGFTVLSFLTTTGYVASEWNSLQIVFGSGAIGTLLTGLAIVGGGVATTAGGIKLLRIYVLVDHCRSEIETLISPSQVSRYNKKLIKMHVRNATMAWVFCMVFALVFALVLLALCMSGLDLDTAVQFAVAGVTNTGPLVDQFGQTQVLAIELPDMAKGTLVAAMVFGRLEVLAFLALLNPDLWG